MYVQFFGLQQPPFSIAPDPRYLFMSERHREALAHLLYGVGGGGGFVLLSGEIGAGKTTICRCFLEQVPDGCQVAYIFNPRLTVAELLQSVCQEFGVLLPALTGEVGVGAAAVASPKACIDALNTHLLAAHAQGRQCVLIIDEAQNLAPEVLEQLRLLTNLETHQRKLLQIMLIGQPELREMLASPGLEQLAQRVIARYHLGALSAAETTAYLAHRLAVAGRPGSLPFDTAALRRIQQITRGVPRRINLLADRALLGAFAEGRPQVGRRIVEQAAREVFDLRPGGLARRQAWGRAGRLALGLALLSGLGWGAWQAGRAGPAAPERSALAARAALAVLPAASAAARAAAVASPPAAASAPAAATAPVAASAQAAVNAQANALALAGAPRDDLAGWRELAALWGVPAADLGPGEPCAALRARQLRCYRSGGSTLAQLRQWDRPGLLQLHLGDGPPRVLRLVALQAGQVVLALGQQPLTLPLADFSRLWRGEFATLWRPPAGYAEVLQPGASGPAVDALAAALATSQGELVPAPGQALAGALAGRLAAFQVAQSLRPDGWAGPTTFMQLNRATGVAEPRLAAAPLER